MLSKQSKLKEESRTHTFAHETLSDNVFNFLTVYLFTGNHLFNVCYIQVTVKSLLHSASLQPMVFINKEFPGVEIDGPNLMAC